MADGAVFTPAGAREIVRQVRRIKGTPDCMLRVPERISRIHLGGGSGGGNGGGGTSGPFTIQEYDAAGGDVVHQFDRGRSRTNSSPTIEDTDIILSSDEEYLYAIGRGEVNADSGCITKWNLSTYDLVWRSDRNGLTATPVSSSTPVTRQLDQMLCEASDGYIWACSGVNSDSSVRVSRTDPDTGIQSHSVSDGANFGHALFTADSSGGIIVSNQSTATGGNYLAVIDTSGSPTATGTTAVRCAFRYSTYLIYGGATTLEILNAADLTSVRSRSNPASEAYISVVSDGTTVWTLTFNSGAGTYKIRAYDFTNLATETFNASLSGSLDRFVYRNGQLAVVGTSVQLLNTSNGSVTWSQTSLGTPNRGTCCDIGSDFVVFASAGDAVHDVWCFELSTGAIRWKDFITGARSVVVSSDDRIFICSQRNQP